MFASYAGGTEQPLDPSDGRGIDIDSYPPFLGSIGVVVGAAFDASEVTGTQPKFFVQRSTESTTDDTFVLGNHIQPVNTENVDGAVAVDERGTVWFGGGSCEAQFPCAEYGAFLGYLATTGSPTMLVERPGAASAITSMDVIDGVLVVGGRYTGALEMMGASFPEATGYDAFVMAIDTVTEDLLWSYPQAGDDIGYDPALFDTVVDLAALGGRDCGAVYVLGCEVASTTSDPDCVFPETGKSGFILKIDVTTGARVWSQVMELANPGFEFFVPTAITASEDKVWLAATVLGQLDIAGGTVIGAAPQESVVVQIGK